MSIQPTSKKRLGCMVMGLLAISPAVATAQKTRQPILPVRGADLPPMVITNNEPAQPTVPPKQIPPMVMPTSPAPMVMPAPMTETAKTTMVASSGSTYRVTLADALRTGHDRHPSIKALRASLQAGHLKMNGLNEVHFLSGGLLPDLKYRKQQLDVGTQASVAELSQAEHEVSYAVIRCFFTVIYAREQGKVAKDLVDQLELYLEQVRKIVNSKGGGVKGVSKDTEDKLVIVLSEAKGKLIEAETGIIRAKAALREAIGLSPEHDVDTADELLPEVVAEFTKETIVNHALTRRGEITLSRIGVEVTQLEVVAQWSRRLAVRVPTFAMGGDIHSKNVPAPTREPDYRPGAVPPEMPSEIVGHRKTRAAIAQQYVERAESVSEQARNLIALEAEAGFSKYLEAAKKVELFKEAAKAGKALVERQREATGGNLTKEDILLNEVSATKAFASYNQALYEQIIALANLERITAGGVRVNFPGR